MRRAILLAVVALAAAPAAARADRIAVKVVDVAGGVAYVEPGGDAGLEPGSVVRLGDRSFVVTGTSRTSAALRVEGDPPAVGADGSVDVDPVVRTVAPRKPTPRSLDAYRMQWPAAVLPASTQTPKPVPLGSSGPTRSLQESFTLGLLATTAGDVALSGGARVSYNPWREGALGADLDASVRVYPRDLIDAVSGASTRSLVQWSGTRAPVFVRAADLRWGTAADPRFAIGRLRWASASTGMLDGARVSVRGGGFELAGFGGLVPDPENGAPDPSGSRFGVEASWSAPRSAWQPHVSAELLGSVWSGALDERRLTLAADAGHGDLSLDGFAEVTAFAADNPFGARSIEVTGAGLDASWLHRDTHASASVSMTTPERSLRLLATIPVDWLCVRDPASAATPEACLGNDRTWSAVASGGTRLGRVTVDLGGSAGRTRSGDVSTTDAAAFGLLGVPVRALHGRLLLGASAGKTGFLDWVAGDVGIGSAPMRRLDASLRVRPEMLTYHGALAAHLVTNVVADLRYRWHPDLDLGGSLSVLAGSGEGAAALLLTLSWRP